MTSSSSLMLGNKVSILDKKLSKEIRRKEWLTSSTTAVAFFANAFSPIMPIRAFGIFTGVLIPINFFLVVMIMPPAVIYYEAVVKKKYTRMCGCCPGKGKCCCCPAKQDAESTEVEDVAEGK
jgi:predicted RND superfamily exporter protein